ncbi:transmembrane protein 254 [Denticeps clupeoides]|uniref:Transmembrane protein 254 n=1 Tax=Denticeps clupeoides TaxID=299321 RepID=A0AAY4BCD4_9TELE|nr:transmembrane protein 254 [Denticeps clupeoides]
MAKSDGSAYFRRSSSAWIISITLAVGYYTWIVFWPDTIPYSLLGPFGSLCKHLVVNHYPLMYYGWWLALAIHVAEALFALKLCSDKGVSSVTARSLWFVQTFLFGIASLGLLIRYRPDHRRKQH